MLDNINYMHFGNSLENSLKDYGMVCRKERSDQFYFIYKVNETYEEGFISETDIKDFMNGEAGYCENEIRDFLHKTDEKSYLNFMELPILEKVYKLSSHFGVETILGKAIQGLTLSSAVDMIESE